MAVQYSLPTLMKHVARAGGRLQWATSTPLEEAIPVLAQAAYDAYPPVDPDVATLDFTGPGAGEGGPVLYINRCEASWIGEHFITGIATALETAGYGGRLREAVRVIEPHFQNPSVIMAAQLELDWDAFMGAGPNYAGMPHAGWWVAPDRTQRVLGPWIEWVTASDHCWLRLDAVTSKLSGPQALDIVLRTLETPQIPHQMDLFTYDETAEWGRRLCLEPLGWAGLQSWAPAVAWTEHARSLIDLVSPVTDDLSSAFLRHAWHPNRSQALSEPLPPWPDVKPMSGLVLPHLNDSYLYDAHGWQLVTDEHLGHLGALDPTRWTVDAMGPHRHTVAAHDLAPWLDADASPVQRGVDQPPTPPVPVLEQARADFAGALLTPGVLADNPFPPFEDVEPRHTVD